MPQAIGGRLAAGCFAAVLLVAHVHAGAADAEAAAALHARYAALGGQLRDNQFGRPLHMDSDESGERVSGEVHALVAHPFATVAAALTSARDWCEILSLHINTKYCRASARGQASVLNVSIGSKHDQPLADAYALELVFRVNARSEGYMRAAMTAIDGPLSTRDYRLTVAAVPVDGGRTFLHLSYSYGFGVAGRLAMQAYLGTLGRGKVGFTVTGAQSDGRPRHVGGMRGVVERNTMRHYLAIDVFLGALSAPPQARLEKRLRDWFAAAAQYPRQLHEMEQEEYLDMKRKEHQRQQAGVPRPRETARVQAPAAA